MARVEHKFGIWVECTDCGGHGVNNRGIGGRSKICSRCNGESHVPLIVTPPEMAALLAGGHVESELSGKYTVRTASGAFAHPETTLQERERPL
jgi:hypothetical protein